MPGTNELILLIRAKDAASQEFKKVEGVINSFSGNVRSRINSISQAVFSFKGALASLGVSVGIGVITKSFINAASSVEMYGFRLRALLGSQEAANRKLQQFRDYASTVPHTLQDIINAGVSLEAFGVKSDYWLKPLGDLAFVMGVSLPEAASAMGRAYAGGAGAADIFRERGILNVIKDAKGIEDLSKLTLPEFRKAMYEAFTDPNGKIAGAAKAAAGTWSGMISMLEDAWFDFRVTVMDAGLFDFLKGMVTTIKDNLGEMKKTGELKQWARDLADSIISSFRTIAIGIAYVGDSFRGWKMIWAGLKMAFDEFAIGVYTGANWIQGLVVKILESFNFKGILDDALADARRVSGEQQEMLGQLIVGLNQAYIYLQNIVDEPSLSDKTGKFFDKLIQNLRRTSEAAKDTANNVAAAAGIDFGSPLLDEDRLKQVLAQRQTLYVQYLDLTKDNYRSENEFVNEQLDARVAAFSATNKDEVAIAQFTVNEKLRLEQEVGQRRLDVMHFISSSALRDNKAFFEVMKVADIAQATMDTYTAANKAMTAAPPPWSYALAAAAVAAGMANVQKIASTKFGSAGGPSGSGGGSPSGSFGVASTGQTAASRQQTANVPQNVQIIVHGSIVDHAAFVRELQPYFKEVIIDTV